MEKNNGSSKMEKNQKKLIEQQKTIVDNRQKKNYQTMKKIQREEQMLSLSTSLV